MSDQRDDRRRGPDRSAVGSWLSGPGGARPADAELGYRGQRLGLPESGAGSVAGMVRRFVAILIDWFASTFVAGLFNHDALPFSGHPSYLPLLVFGLEVWILTATTGASFGQRLVGLRVVSLDGRPLNPVRAFVRTVLLCLAVPALIWDRDLRGLHDKAANTVVVRA